MDPVKISYESFLKNRDVLSWNTAIGSKILKNILPGQSAYYKCKDCDFGHKQQVYIVNHVELKHLERFPGYTCALCKLVLQTWLIFKNHVTGSHCSNPSAIRESIKGLNDVGFNSLSARNDATLHKCDSCDFKTNNEKHLQKHNVENHWYNKNIDQAKSSTLKAISDVIGNMSDQIQPFKCPECGLLFTKGVEFELHNKLLHNSLQTRSVKQKLDVNEMSFDVPVYIPSLDNGPGPGPEEEHRAKARKRAEVRRQQNPFNCYYCIKNFNSLAECSQHEEAHRGSYPFNCHLCSRSGFRQRARFMHHMTRAHNILVQADLLSSCSDCFRVLLTPDMLRKHLQQTDHGRKHHGKNRKTRDNLNKDGFFVKHNRKTVTVDGTQKVKLSDQREAIVINGSPLKIKTEIFNVNVFNANETKCSQQNDDNDPLAQELEKAVDSIKEEHTFSL